jgi:peptide-methionine (S)-S-oxide reductase
MGIQTASFAAGCFWGVEARFREAPGVVDAAVGYMGGHLDEPTYKQVCAGDTGHAEAVQLVFDEERISYRELLDLFFDMHNPTTLNRQGPDFGSQYRSAVFWHNDEQRAAAEQKITAVNASGSRPFLARRGIPPALLREKRRRFLPRVGAASVFQFPDNPEQDYRADRGGDYRADDTRAEIGAEQAEQPAAEDTTDNADDDVHHDALSLAFHDLAGQPARDAANDQ